MERFELTVEQCRALARLRDHRPDARVDVHRTPGGLIVEVRRGVRVALARLEPSGNIVPDRPLGIAR